MIVTPSFLKKSSAIIVIQQQLDFIAATGDRNAKVCARYSAMTDV